MPLSESCFTAWIAPFWIGWFDPDDDVSYTSVLEPGEVVTLAVDPGEFLQSQIEISNASEIHATASSGSPGQEVIIQTIPVDFLEIYKITVKSRDGSSSGVYTVDIFLNAAVESDDHGGPTNDPLITSQDIEGNYAAQGLHSDRAFGIKSPKTHQGKCL